MRLGITSQDDDPADFPTGSPYSLAPGTTIAWVDLPSCVPPSLASSDRVGSPPQKKGRQPLSRSDSALARMKWYWNIDQSSIAYASRPRLRSRLTLGG